MPGVTRAEFELEYAQRAHVWIGASTKTAVPCDCGSQLCQGWKMTLKEPDFMGLVYFRGGPLDEKAYETKDLVTSEARLLPLVQYRWTPETITSPKTGQVARIWLHESLLTEQVTSQVQERGLPSE